MAIDTYTLIKNTAHEYCAKTHLESVLWKIKYFVDSDNIKIIEPLDTERMYLQVGKYEVVINKDTMDSRCTCKKEGLYPIKGNCSHILAAYAYLVKRV